MRALSIGLCSILLAGCAGTAPAPDAGMPFAIRHPAAGYVTAYDFAGPPMDGSQPVAGVVAFEGAIYGTTSHGGDVCCNNGAIYVATPDGRAEALIHSFGGLGDGAGPSSSLIAYNGLLYGTTGAGGAHGKGAVFSVTSKGDEHVLYSFKGGVRDGGFPDGALLESHGFLYGTTYTGGKHDKGTVFALDPATGNERVLHDFGAANDGATPQCALIEFGGKFYGTTTAGGSHRYGTVFSIDAAGSERVVHAFAGGDGALPLGDLIAVGNAMYGTTYNGIDFGNVYRITTGGAVTNLHAFKTGNDGANPAAGLAYANGKLYGTTVNGGAHNQGTVFSVTLAGTERIVYSFPGGSNGGAPVDALVYQNGMMTGTTQYGGGCTGYTGGCGTIFTFTP